MPPRLSLEGRVFGRLTVSRLSHVQVCAYWSCACECGNMIVVRGTSLIQGRTKSCGCLYSETRVSRFKHGGSLGGKECPEYVAWKNMRRRCEFKSHKHYRHYGGRGIAVCARWRSFANFLADMGRRPSPKLTLERVDNDGNYEPSNCCWASRSAQNANRRRL